MIIPLLTSIVAGVSLSPLISLIAGVLILIMPRLLNFIVAIYLIIIGLVGLFHLLSNCGFPVGFEGRYPTADGSTALNRQIQDLEEGLGVELIRRSPHPARLRVG